MKIKTNESRKAVIYCRVSTEEQTFGGSLNSQERECRSFAQRQGLDVVKIFREEGESGRSGCRTQLNAMVNFVSLKQNDIGYVVVLKVDRLMRNHEEFYALETVLRKFKVRILYVLENNENNSNGKLARGISGVMAEYESNVNSERTKAGNREAFLNGRYIKKLKGYSFKVNPLGKKQIYPNEDAKYITKGFELMSKGIYSQREVLATLKMEGFNSYPQAFNKILHNPVYCGWLPDTQGANNGEPVKGIHEPLVSKELFDKVQDIIDGKRPTVTPRKRNNPEFPLRRFIRCKKCGSFMTSSFSQGKNRKYGYYHCSRCSSSPESRILKNNLEKGFLEYLKSLNIDNEAIHCLQQTVISVFRNKTQFLAQQRRVLDKSKKELEEEKSRLIRAIAAGSITGEDGAPEIQKINAQIAEKQVLISGMDDSIDIDECWEFVKYFLNNLADIWTKADLSLKQKLQCLISPEGFYFEEKTIKHVKIPYFISIFCSKTRDFKSKGG